MGLFLHIEGERHVPPKDWMEQTKRAFAEARCPVDGAKLMPQTWNVIEDCAACSECARAVHLEPFRHTTALEHERRKKAAVELHRRAERSKL